MCEIVHPTGCHREEAEQITHLNNGGGDATEDGRPHRSPPIFEFDDE